MVSGPLVYATALLGDDAGNIGHAILNITTIISALILSVPIVDSQGLKAGLIVGQFMYFLYVGLFTMALGLMIASQYNMLGMGTSADTLKLTVFISASIFGGIGSGILWTAQGGYFSYAVDIVSREQGCSRADMSADLAGQFAFIYFLFEALAKLGFSGLQSIGLQNWLIGAIYSGVALMATLMMMRMPQCKRKLPSSEEDDDEERSPWYWKLTETVRLWPTLKLWLLSPLNILFGFSSAYLNGFFNGHFTVEATGAVSLGLLSAVTVACAAGFSQTYRCLVPFTGKFLILCIGCLSIAFIPFATLALGCCKDWRWNIIVLYVMQGSGRAVYDSTNRAVFSDYFRGEDIESAFANSLFQTAASSAICFIVSSHVRLTTYNAGDGLQWVMLILAVISPVIYFAAFKYATISEAGEDKRLIPRARTSASGSPSRNPNV